MIVFDGVDRAGKTSTRKWLAEKLEEDGDVVNQITTDSLIGNYIPSLFGHAPDEIVYMLFWQAIREADLTKITPALERDETVIVDRYYLSNLAYDWWENLDGEFKSHMDEVYLDRCLRPDVMFLFTIPYEVFVERDDGDTVFNRSAFEAIQCSYLWWGQQLTTERICNVVIIDGSLPQEEVYELVYNTVQSLEESVHETTDA